MTNNPLLIEPIAPLLKRLTLPVMGGMLTLMSFNLVDTFFISMLGTKQLAAISFTFPVTFLIISLAIGLSIGTSAVIARALGAGQTETAKNDSLAAMWLSALSVLVLACAAYIWLDPLFMLLGATTETLGYIREYMVIWLAGSALLVTPMVGNAILRAAGETRIPSLVMACGGVVNAILDPILIFGFGPIPAMGMSGAALATVISWLSGFIFIVYWLSAKRGLLTSWYLPFAQFMQICRKILHIGLPAAGANMLTPLAMAVLTAIMATHGPEAVAAFGVGARLESIASLVVLALSMTLPPVISQNIGASQFSRVREAYRLSCRFIMLWQLAIYVVLVLLAYPIAAAFTDNAQVAHYVHWYIWIMPVAYGLQGIIILTNSSFNALHLPGNALLLSVLRLFICYVPLGWLGGVMFGVIGVFIGCIVANLITASIAYYSFNRVVQRFS